MPTRLSVLACSALENRAEPRQSTWFDNKQKAVTSPKKTRSKSDRARNVREHSRVAFQSHKTAQAFMGATPSNNRSLTVVSQ
jgi:hypothetical protein